MKDWSEGGSLCLAKALLTALDPSGDGMKLYKSYFRAYTLTDVEANLSCLDQFDGEVLTNYLKMLYKSDWPMKQPDWLSFNSRCDVNRLAELVNHEVVIYIATNSSLDQVTTNQDFIDLADLAGLKPFQNDAKRLLLEPYYDFRCYSERLQKRYFLINSSRSKMLEIPLTLYPVIEGCVDRALLRGRELWTKITPLRYGNASSSYLEGLRKLLSCNLSPPLPESLSIAKCCDILSVNEQALFEALDCSECLIVYKCQYKTPVSKRQRGKRDPFNYTTLAVVAPALDANDLETGTLQRGF